MRIPRVTTHRGVTVDLEEVKCFNTIGERSYVMIIEFKSNVKYIFNPHTEEHELHTFNDKVEVKCRDFTTAGEYMIEWAEIWEQYLTERDG